ncbi:MAG: hypothetical protein AAGB93_03245 [Planctomycetota bacterium]
MTRSSVFTAALLAGCAACAATRSHPDSATGPPASIEYVLGADARIAPGGRVVGTTLGGRGGPVSLVLFEDGVGWIDFTVELPRAGRHRVAIVGAYGQGTLRLEVRRGSTDAPVVHVTGSIAVDQNVPISAGIARLPNVERESPPLEPGEYHMRLHVVGTDIGLSGVRFTPLR